MDALHYRDELRVKRDERCANGALIERPCEGVVEDVGGVWDGVRELGCAVLPLELDGVGGVVGIGDVGGEVGDDNGNWGLGIDMGRDVPMSVRAALMVDERRRRERRRAS